jgi:hypothetical protein
MVITEGVRTLHELMEDGKRFNSISVLRFRSAVSHNGKNVTCQAQNPATPQPQLISTRSGPNRNEFFSFFLTFNEKKIFYLMMAV